MQKGFKVLGVSKATKAIEGKEAQKDFKGLEVSKATQAVKEPPVLQAVMVQE